MDKCRTCKWFKLSMRGFTCEKNRRIIVGGWDNDCKDYEPKNNDKS